MAFFVFNNTLLTKCVNFEVYIYGTERSIRIPIHPGGAFTAVDRLPHFRGKSPLRVTFR